MVKTVIPLIIAIFMTAMVDAQNQPSTIKPIRQYTSAFKQTNFNGTQTKIKKSDNTKKLKLDSVIEYNLNEATNLWDKKFGKNAYQYDKNFNETLYTHYSWNAVNNSWDELIKVVSNYNEKGNITDFIYYSTGYNKLMNPIQKDSFLYNEKNELINNLSYYWKRSTSSWELAEKELYSYDANGKILSDSTFLKYAEPKGWVLSKKTEYQYLNDNQLHYTYQSTMDNNTNEWVYDKKEWFLYGNIKWLLYTISTYSWDATDAEWKRFKLEGFGYDDTDKVNTVTETSKNLDSNKWVESILQVYKYDYSLSLDELVLPGIFATYGQKYFHHKVVSKQLSKRDFEANKMNQYRDVQYYYSSTEKPTAIRNIKQEQINVYPNPATDRVTIKYQNTNQQATLNLYNNQGCLVLAKPFKNDEDINVGHLKSGMYFFQIISDNAVEKGKFIIK